MSWFINSIKCGIISVAHFSKTIDAQFELRSEGFGLSSENTLRFHIRRLEDVDISRAASMQAKVDRLVNLRVPEAVRSAMKETAEVKAQFSQLSEHAVVLTEENAALRERRSQLSVDVSNLEQMLKKVSRQSCVQKKVTISVQFIELSLCMFMLVFSVSAIVHSSFSLHQSMEQLRGNYQQVQHELNDCRHELEQLQTKHREVVTEMQAHGSACLCSSHLREV